MNLLDLLNKDKKKKSSKRETAKNVAIGAGIGTAVGVTAGVLLAPKSGKETREVIAKTTKETLENVKDGLNVAKEKIEDLIKKDNCCCSDKDKTAEKIECKEGEKAE